MDTSPLEEEPTVEGLQGRLRKALCGPLDAQWSAVLEQASDLPPSGRKEVRASVSALRNQLLERLLEIDERAALEQGIALQYLELKCRWATLTMMLQRQSARQEGVEDPLLYRATCLSVILQALEPFRAEGRLSDLTDALLEPLD